MFNWLSVLLLITIWIESSLGFNNTTNVTTTNQTEVIRVRTGTVQQQTVNLTFNSRKYETFPGSRSVKLTCTGLNLSPVDLVWIVHFPDSATTTDSKTPLVKQYNRNVVFSDNNYIGNSSLKYFVECSTESSAVVGGDVVTTSSLTVRDVNEHDMMAVYECVCNIYKKCVNQAVSSNATLVHQYSPFNNLFNFNGKSSSSCLQIGIFSQSQHILIVLSYFILLLTSLELSFLFQRKFRDSFLLYSALIFSALFELVGVVIWIFNISVLSASYSSILTVLCLQLGCFLLWSLILKYVISLRAMKILKSTSLGIVATVFLLELVSAGMILTSHAYCQELLILPEIKNFNYSFVEMIGASFFLVFSFILFIVCSISFFVLQQQRIQICHDLMSASRQNSKFLTRVGSMMLAAAATTSTTNNNAISSSCSHPDQGIKSKSVFDGTQSVMSIQRSLKLK